ncbi:MAG: cyclopropane-fatty-acyl-phospholipid synthase family protein [Gammaproteobacteria bacterium]|nr:cyclopropane-fatty-acyl-phospholipid synthase family protein [Gammaproteobacteria bacterium]
MNTKALSIDSPRFLGHADKPRWLDSFARRLVLEKLRSLSTGEVTVIEGDREETFGHRDDEFPFAARLHVKSPAFYSDVAFGGSVGAGEAFIHDYWETDDAVALGRILLRNRDVLDEVDRGTAVVTRPLRNLFHWLNRNTKTGSRRNISAHYDLGNDFYSLWLDPQMMYSSAWYASKKSTLDEAAVAKLDRICQRLNLGPGDRVIEIGTGWGGFAVHAAKHYSCHVTTTTISRQQYACVQSRIAAEGLADHITLLQSDYRDLDGQYDKLVSIEMIEAVGHEYLETYLRKCSSLLQPKGEMLIQAITIADQRYESAKRNVDFIKRYIFPGGFLPSVTAMTATLTAATDLRAINIEDIGLHYARTLHDWRERFFANLDAVREQGFSETFIRMWDFYLTYCESGFLERAVGNVQLHAIKPLARPAI